MFIDSSININGMIADIQRCSIHDGPGIRTTIFMKGCNVHCAWCHNPETIDSKPEWLYNPEKCIKCGGCEDECFSGAKILCGKEMTVSDVLKEIMLDKPYYGKDGGLTISGGEPLLQKAFTYALLNMAKNNGINVAIESNLSFPWNTVKPIVSLCDLVMADLKIWNNDNHKKWVGINNGRIRENLCKISQLNIPIILRTPVIPGINANYDEIIAIAKFASKLTSLLYYELLPYHPFGQSKNLRDSGFQAMQFDTPNKDDMDKLAHTAKSEGVRVRISGKQV
jgi:glycyl-radical enzyme activating protein